MKKPGKIRLALLVFFALVALYLLIQVTTHAATSDFISVPFDSNPATNPYPIGQCTWYADGRYAALHNGVHIPWTTQANAWQWTARAYEYGWQVSTRPTVGAIVDLQPYVQWAGGLGHVAIVEQILPDGSVLASNMNWGLDYWQTSHIRLIHFYPGPGVTFIQQP